jgi:hypothetical protein
MKKNIFKILKWTGAFLLLVSIGTGFYLMNQHLKTEKLYFYETGTDKKAILNSTWNMSQKEVERANNTNLKEGFTLAFLEKGLNGLLSSQRITSQESTETINLWTEDATISYEFFDDRLFRYWLVGKTLNKHFFDSTAIRNLELSYGKIKRDTTLYGGSFFKDSVSVKYSQFDIETKEKRQEHRFVIEVTYSPIFNEIIRTANKEQNSIFQ